MDCCISHLLRGLGIEFLQLMNFYKLSRDAEYVKDLDYDLKHSEINKCGIFKSAKFGAFVIQHRKSLQVLCAKKPSPYVEYCEELS